MKSQRNPFQKKRRHEASLSALQEKMPGWRTKKISLRRKTDFHPDIIFSLHDSFSVKKVIFAKQT